MVLTLYELAQVHFVHVFAVVYVCAELHFVQHVFDLYVVNEVFSNKIQQKVEPRPTVFLAKWPWITLDVTTGLQCRAKWLRDSREKVDKLVETRFNETKMQFMQYFPLSPESMLTSDYSQTHGLEARQQIGRGGNLV